MLSSSSRYIHACTRIIARAAHQQCRYSLCQNGDSTNRASVQAVLTTLQSQSNCAAKFKLLHADPPYCLLERRRTLGDLRDPKGRKNESTGRYASVSQYRDFTRAWMTACMPFAHDDATMIVWTNFLGRTPILHSAAELGYSHLCGEFLWCKRPSTVKRVPVVFGNATDKSTESAPNSPMKRFNQPASMISHVAGEGGGESRLLVVEFALVLRKSALPDLQPQDPSRCWSVVSGYDDDGEAAKFQSHPNHKPFTVLEPLLRAHSRVGDVVFEPFAGSGSTLAAAHKLNRHVAGLELDERWASVARHRLSSL